MSEKKDVNKDEQGTETEISEDKLNKAMDGLEDVAKGLEENHEEQENEEIGFVEKAMLESDDIKKGVEVSDFLSEVVNQIGDSVDSMTTLVKSQTGAIKDTLGTMAKSLKSIGEATLELSKRVTEVEKTPTGTRKSILSKSEKGIKRFGDDEDELTKSQVLDKMVRLVTKEVEGISANDVIAFENSGQIRASVKELVLTS